MVVCFFFFFFFLLCLFCCNTLSDVGFLFFNPFKRDKLSSLNGKSKRTFHGRLFVCSCKMVVCLFVVVRFWLTFF